MKRNESIRKVMTSNPMSVQVGQPVHEAYKLLLEHDFHHIPVVDGDKLVGLVTSTDIGRITYSFDTDDRMTSTVLDHTRTLSEIMKKDVTTIPSSATVRDAVEILADGAYHALPVVDGDKLVGIVTSTDLLRYLKEQY